MNATIWGRWVSRLFQQRRFARRPQLVQRRLLFETLEDRVVPATISWTGNGANNFWNTSANWDLGRAPLAGDDLVFGGLAAAANRTAIDNLAGLPLFNSITISANGYLVNGTVASPKLALAGPITVGSNLGNNTISLDLQLIPPIAAPQQTITVNTGSTLTLSGHLSGNSNAAQAALQTLTKAGPGILELTNDNSAFTGAVTLANNGGVVAISHANALGLGAVISGAPTAGLTTVNDNSQLQLKNLSSPVNERLKLNGSGIINDGALLNFFGNNTWAGSVTLDTDASIGANASSSVNITGQISDTGAGHSLTKEGAGRVILGRVGGNTYRGQTIINNGILTVRDPLSLGAGADATKLQNGSPQSGTIVNFNSTTGVAGTLQLEFTTLSTNDPNGILLNPSMPFDVATNPYVGFQVYNDLLTVNGPGFGGIGAISNLTGRNEWSGDVTVGSAPPSTGAVRFGADTNSTLIVSGVIADPNRQPLVEKVLPGRVVFNNTNTYRGSTRVLAGSLNIRDSRALGTGVVDVRSGGALELEVDKGIDGTPLRNRNRNLGFDSVNRTGPGQEVYVDGTSGTFTLTFNGQTTGALAFNVPAAGGAGPTASVQNALNALASIGGVGGSVTVTKLGPVYRVIFGGTLANVNVVLMTASGVGGTTAIVSPIYGLTVSNTLYATGSGVVNGGALRSVSGINVYSGNVPMGDLLPPYAAMSATIGVDSDTRPGHLTASADYFTNDHSLTVTGTISGGTDLNRITLSKSGTGHLILPNANTYVGPTNIQQGWVTVQNNDSLGFVSPVTATTLRQYTTISDGAALHLKPLVPGTSFSMRNNFIISGLGIDHPFGLLHQAGAIENLDGRNTLSGIIQLNGPGGIGVEQINPVAPGTDPSQLTLTGNLWDFGSTPGGITKLGSRRLIIQADGTYTGTVDIRDGALLAQNSTALGAAAATPVGGTVQGLVHNYELNGSYADSLGGPSLVPNGGTLTSSNYVFGPGQGLTLSNALLTPADNYSIEVVFSITDISFWRNLIEFKNGLADTGLYNFNGALQFFNEATGPSGAFSPDVTATLLLSRDASTKQVIGYVNGVEQLRFTDSADLAAFSGPAGIMNFFIDDQVIPGENSGGMVDRIRIFDRPLTPAQLNPVGNSTIVQSDAALEIGNMAQNQNGGVESGLGIWNEHLILNGAGNAFFNDSALTVLAANGPVTGPTNNPVIATDNSWRGPVTLGSDATITVQPGSRLVVTGAIDDAANPSTVGSSLTIDGGGELNLLGASSYRGSTFVNQGVLTIGNGQALGTTGNAEIQTIAITSATHDFSQFTLTFNGQTTASILYTGDAATDAAAIQAALAALPGLGAAAVGATVSVSSTAQDVFDVTFGGSLIGFDQVPMTALVVTGPGVIDISQSMNGAGGTTIANGASLHLVGSFTVAGEPLRVNGQGAATGVPAIPVQWFPLGPAPIANGQTPSAENTTGRINATVVDPRDNNIIYVGTSGGGVWKTIDGGKNWRPIFDAIPEIQRVTIGGAAGTFTLSFLGDTTGDLTSNSTADEVQAALNALPSLGGSGAVVTVTKVGSVFTITFGGNLAGVNIDVLTATPAGGATASVQTLQHGKNANFAMYIGTLLMNPNDPNTLYAGTGETNNSPDSFYGTGIYVTNDAGATWRVLTGTETQVVDVIGLNGTFTLTYDGATTVPISDTATAAEVQTALNNLTTINGNGGAVTVTRTGIGEIQEVTVLGGLSATADTYTLEFGGQTTAALAFNATPAQIKTALENLTTIGGFGTGGIVTVGAPTGISEVQELTINFSSTIPTTTYTLTFGGQTTAALPFNATANQIRQALNALTSIGAGGVTVLQTGGTAGSNTYEITFRNALGIYQQPLVAVTNPGNAFISGNVVELVAGGAFYDVTFGLSVGIFDQPLMTLTGAGLTTGDVVEVSPGGAAYHVTFGGILAQGPISVLDGEVTPGDTGTVEVEVEVAANPLDGKGISKIVVDPNSGVIYTAVGDSWVGRDEVQEITPELVNPDDTFTLTFTGPNAAGVIVTLTTAPIVWNVTTQPNRVLTAQRIQDALNALGNIGGVGGEVSVTIAGGFFSTSFDITFLRALSNTNVVQLTATPPPPPTFPGVGIETLIDGDSAHVINGTPGGAGVWRLQNGVWVNLTNIVSPKRAGLATTQALPPTAGAFSTATPFGTGAIPNNPGPDDDYRMTFPETNATWSDISLIYADTSNQGFPPGAPVLYAALGNSSGSINNAVFWTENPTSATPIWYVGDPGGSPFSSPAMAPAATVSDSRTGGFPRGQFEIPVLPNPPGGSQPEVPQNGNIKISAVSGGNFNAGTVYAAVSTPFGSLLNVFKTTDGGANWAATTAPANYLFVVGGFSNAILAVDANTVFIGGQGTDSAGNHTILMTTDGGTTWTDISIDANGNGPHAGMHGFSRDSAGRLLVSTDGGVWRRETNGNWTNLNGNLSISLVNGVASNPNRIDAAFAGSQANGVESFLNSQTWTRVDGYGGGRVAVDPVNPQNVYYIELQVGGNALVRRSTNGGATWSTALSITSQTAPLVLDSVNPSRLLVGGSELMESLNQGATWTNLLVPADFSPSDVAIANAQGAFVLDPAFLQVGDLGANSYDPDTIYATDGFSVILTKNHAQTWIDTTTNLPTTLEGGIVDLEVDPRNRDTVYLVRNVFGAEKVFMTTDAGISWTDITGNLPDLPTWKVVVDPRTGYLYVGTDEGVFISKNATNESDPALVVWERFGIGMPNVQVKDLTLNTTTNSLLAGTYGRGVYQMFLDTTLTSVTPVNAAVVSLSGSSIWTGHVILNGDSSTNTVTVGAYGTPNLPDNTTVASVSFVGPISDLTAGANPTVEKIGLGDVIFAGSNIYGGETNVKEGALVADNAHALGSNLNQTTVYNGAVLQLRSSLDAEPITLNGDGVSIDDHFTGALRNISGDNTYAGNVTLSTVDPVTSDPLLRATIGVDSGSVLTMTGWISGGNGTFSLVKEQPGTLVLGGASTYTAQTVVNQGALRLENSDALGTGLAVVLDGAQIQLQSPGGGPGVSIDNDVLLSGTGIFGTGALLNTGGSNAWNGDITLAALPGFSPNTFPVGSVAFGVSNFVDTLTIGGAIGESTGQPTGLTKVGNGRLSLLSNNNGYSGATEVIGGILDIHDPGALGIRSGTASTQRIVTLSFEQTGTFRLSFNGQLTGNLNFNASAAAVRSALGALSTVGAANIASVTKTEIQTTTQNGPMPLGSNLGFVYTVVFTGSLANTTIPVGASGAAGTGAAASMVATGGIDVRVSDGAALELTAESSGFNVVNRTLTLNGTGGGTGALHNVSGDNVWNGPVQLPTSSSIGTDAGTSVTLAGGVSGAFSDLTKVGAGTLVFPDVPETNGQARTVISAGNVNVDGLLGDVVLDGGTLAGTGEVGTITSNATGGTINPGDAADPTGTLTSGNTTLNGNDQFFVDLEIADNDLLDVTTGAINLGGAALAGTSELGIPLHQQFEILRTTDPNGVIGHFAGFSTPPVVGGNSATIAYIGGVKYVVDYFSDHVVVTRELANVAITLTPVAPAAVYGQQLTFTATLAPEPGAPNATGQVVFTFDGVDYTVTIGAGGIATFTPTASAPLLLGAHSVSVAYDGIDAASQQVFNPASAGPNNFTVNPAGTSTALTASVASPIYGQSVIFTATVTSLISPQAPGTLAPQGTVTFYRDASILMGTGTLDASGVATFDSATLVTPIGVGSHSFFAVYNSDGSPDNYDGSTSPSITRFVNKSGTATTVVSSGGPTVFGQPVTFTATVVATAPGSGSPTGTVTFRQGGLVIGTGTVNASGVATYTTVGGQIPVGTTTITATYGGDSNFNSSTGSTTQDVTKANSSTSVVSNSNPSVYGQPVTFSATVTGVAPGGGFGSGFVTFKKDGVNIGTGLLNISGVATYTTTLGQLSIGTGYVITAEFAGDNNLNASSGSTTQNVNQSGTATTVVSSANPSVFGEPVTFTATVFAGSPGSGLATGTVTFTLGATTLGTSTLNGSGVATYTTTVGQLPVGVNQTITATYNGDSNYTTSSGTVTQTVNKAGTTTSIVANLNPSGVDQSVLLTATVTVVAPGGGAPTGTVTFQVNGNFLGTGTLSTVGGVTTASFATAPFDLPLGMMMLSADYAGDTNFIGSSNSIAHTVLFGTTTHVTSLSNPSLYGQPVTFTATVAPTVPGATPTGNVKFTVDGMDLGSGVLNGSGFASFTTSPLQLNVGAGQIVTATYEGDATYSASADSLSQTVTSWNTTTQLTSSVSSAVATRGIVFTARVAVVAPGSGIPTGLVTFTDQRTGKVLGTVAVDATGVASVEMFLGSPVGNHTVRANYAGDGNYGASVGTVNVQIVANGVRTSQVILGTSMNPSVVGTAVTFTATVRDVTDFTINPFGTVAFYDGSQLLGFGTLSKVKQGITRATFTTSDLLVGVHSIQARYSGNTTFARRNSPLVSQEVKEIPTRTSTTVLSQLPSTPTGFGVGVTFTAVVTDTGAAPSISPTGTVTFTDTTTGTVLGTVSLSTLSATQSQAVLTTNALGVGSHVIEATYDGDTDFVSEVSNSVTHDVTSVGSTLSLTSSSNPSKFGQAVTFTARVSPVSGTGVATGTVVFKDGGVVVGTGTLNSSGVATLTTGVLSVGTHTITAEYAGDGNVTGSMSSPLTQTVDKSGTQVLIGRSTADAKKPLTLSAKVEALAPGSGIPTGMVTFVIDGIVRGTGVLDASGVATLFIQGGLSQGQHTIVAQYAGDTNYNPRSGSKVFEFGGRLT